MREFLVDDIITHTNYSGVHTNPYMYIKLHTES